jgi:hypothetical protein
LPSDVLLFKLEIEIVWIYRIGWAVSSLYSSNGYEYCNFVDDQSCLWCTSSWLSYFPQKKVDFFLFKVNSGNNISVLGYLQNITTEYCWILWRLPNQKKISKFCFLKVLGVMSSQKCINVYKNSLVLYVILSKFNYFIPLFKL